MGSYILNKAKINPNFNKRFIVVDDFYENPDYIREKALMENFFEGGEGKGYMGNRTPDYFFAPNMQQAFESIIGNKINNWYDGDYCNGVFQFCTKSDKLVYHCDGQDWAGAIYLNKNAPYNAGTSFFASKRNGQRGGLGGNFNSDIAFQPEADEDPFLNPNLYEKVDEVGNVYNRLVLWDAQLIHAASEYFGETAENSRLFHLFFFNVAR
jgi:hypothetical protein